MSELDPTPELPDETPIERVRFPARIKNVFSAEGIQTVGQARETSDDTLLSFPDLGRGSVAHVRETLGLPSTKGVRPDGMEGYAEMTEPRPFRHRWTSDELKQLEEMLNEGKTAPQIAKKLNRTTQAIYSRVQRIYRKRENPLRHRVQWGLKAKK